MKRIFLLLPLCLLLLVMFCSCAQIHDEEKLIKKYEQTHSRQSIYNLFDYYIDQNNYQQVVRYGNELFAEVDSLRGIKIWREGYEYDPDYALDSYLQDYCFACSHVYKDQEYVDALLAVLDLYTDFGYAAVGYSESIDEYYSLSKNVDVCLVLYDKLIESSDHIYIKKLYQERKVSFLKNNTDYQDDIISEEIILRQYEEEVSNDILKAKESGMSVEEYLEKVRE